MTDKTSRLLEITNNKGDQIVAQIEHFILDYDRKCTLEFNCSLTGKLIFIESDFFECLINLRKELDKYDYYPLCNGARVDVYPSGMCRDMGNGLVAYIQIPNKQVNSEDLVNIFDFAESNLIASVDKQYKFYKSLIYSEIIQNPSELEL
jgi:hypothetical protein